MLQLFTQSSERFTALGGESNASFVVIQLELSVALNSLLTGINTEVLSSRWCDAVAIMTHDALPYLCCFWFPSKEIVYFGHFPCNPFHSTPTTVLATPELVWTPIRWEQALACTTTLGQGHAIVRWRVLMWGYACTWNMRSEFNIEFYCRWFTLFTMLTSCHALGRKNTTVGVIPGGEAFYKTTKKMSESCIIVRFYGPVNWVQLCQNLEFRGIWTPNTSFRYDIGLKVVLESSLNFVLTSYYWVSLCSLLLKCLVI